jgi:hypothetical protein
VFWCSVQLLCDTFLIVWRTERDVIRKCVSVCCMWSAGYACQMLIQPEYCGQIFAKYSDIHFHENPFGGRMGRRTDGRRDRRAEMSKLIFAFRNVSDAPKSRCATVTLVLFVSYNYTVELKREGWEGGRIYRVCGGKQVLENCRFEGSKLCCLRYERNIYI